MPLTYTYNDAYLRQHITEDREARAVADVGTEFQEPWKGKLAVPRAYIITALECQAQPDDLFAQKLKHYRAEYDALLLQARAATQQAGGSPVFAFSVPIERG